MKKYKRILSIDNEIEANLLSSILDQENIPYLLRSYHDSAYDGLWQSQKGWGHLEAPIEYEEKIWQLYNGIKDSK